MTQRIDRAQHDREQYKDGGNLRTRTSFYTQFGVANEDFYRWSFGLMRAPADARVLELGAGFANLWVKNQDRIPPNWQITLTDLSPGMVAEAQRATAQLYGQFMTRVADVQELDFPDATFDVIIANHVLQHVPKLERAVAEVRRVLKAGGHFYATTNGPSHLTEVQDFIKDIAQESPLDLRDAMGFDKHFGLADGPLMLKKQFETVNVYRAAGGLEVTEAEPYVQFILSRIGWKTLVATLDEQQATRLVAKIRTEVERQLASGPIHITTESGLLEAV